VFAPGREYGAAGEHPLNTHYPDDIELSNTTSGSRSKVGRLLDRLGI
jgi:hypothetical protein